MPGGYLKMLWIQMLFLIVFLVVGIMATNVIDIAPIRGKSSMLFYTVWAVLGVFAGFLIFREAVSQITGDRSESWVTKPEGRRAGLKVALGTLVTLTWLSAIFYSLWWRRDPEGSVPDGMAPTLTYFGATFLATIAGYLILTLSEKQSG